MHDAFNAAADLIINTLLVNDGFTLPPDGVTLRSRHLPAPVREYVTAHSPDEWVTEELADLWLEAMQDDDAAPCLLGDLLVPAEFSGDSDGDGPSTPSPAEMQEAVAEAQAQAGRMVAAAAEAQARSARSADAGWDTLPGWAREFMERLTTPKQDWRTILRQQVHEVAGDPDWSYSRVHIPTYDATGCIAPTLQSQPSVPLVAVLLDSSGSVDDSLLAEFWSEIEGMRQEIDVLMVGHFTTGLQRLETYDRHTPVAPVDRVDGGTDIPAAYSELLDTLRTRPPMHPTLGSLNRPSLVIVLSDMLSDMTPERFPDNPPATLWLGGDKDFVPPFGTVIDCNH